MQEVKTIFGPILPIYSLHRRMLRDLFQLLVNWNEENLIGEIYVKYVSHGFYFGLNHIHINYKIHVNKH